MKTEIKVTEKEISIQLTAIHEYESLLLESVKMGGYIQEVGFIREMDIMGGQKEYLEVRFIKK